MEKLLVEARAEVTRLNKVRPPLPGEKPSKGQQKLIDQGVKLLPYTEWLAYWKTATDVELKLLAQWRQWEKEVGKEAQTPEQQLEAIRPWLIELGWFPPEDLQDPGSPIRLRLEQLGWRPPFGEACRKEPNGTYSNSNHRGDKRTVLKDLLSPEE